MQIININKQSFHDIIFKLTSFTSIENEFVVSNDITSILLNYTSLPLDVLKMISDYNGILIPYHTTNVMCDGTDIIFTLIIEYDSSRCALEVMFMHNMIVFFNFKQVNTCNLYIDITKTSTQQSTVENEIIQYLMNSFMLVKFGINMYITTIDTSDTSFNYHTTYIFTKPFRHVNVTYTEYIKVSNNIGHTWSFVIPDVNRFTMFAKVMKVITDFVHNSLCNL